MKAKHSIELSINSKILLESDENNNISKTNKKVFIITEVKATSKTPRDQQKQSVTKFLYTGRKQQKIQNQYKQTSKNERAN